MQNTGICILKTGFISILPAFRFKTWFFERNKQLFEIKTALEDNINSLQLNFENFRIENFFAIINAEESPVKGIIKGGIELENLENLNGFFLHP